MRKILSNSHRDLFTVYLPIKQLLLGKFHIRPRKTVKQFVSSNWVPRLSLMTLICYSCQNCWDRIYTAGRWQSSFRVSPVIIWVSPIIEGLSPIIKKVSPIIKKCRQSSREYCQSLRDCHQFHNVKFVLVKNLVNDCWTTKSI